MQEIDSAQEFPPPALATREPVDPATISRIEQFLYYEARLLDEHRYDDWLTVLHPDIHYWVPGIQTRYKQDKARYAQNRMAHFDDDLRDLQTRAARHKQPTAWGEDPPTRHNHVVSNIEVQQLVDKTGWLVHSILITIKNRNEDEEDWLSARRKDVVVEADNKLFLKTRYAFLSQSVLLSKNINTFF